MLRIKGTHKGVALSVDCNSRYCALDPYVGAMIAVVESARNVVCARRGPLGITDCLNFGNPEKPEVMWQFTEAVRGIRDACLALERAGRQRQRQLLQRDRRPGDSADADHRHGRACSKTIEHHATQWFKTEGDVIVLLGRTREELGGSEYLALAARHGPRRAAVDRSGGREARAAALPGGDHRGPGPLGTRRRRRRAGGGAGGVLHLGSRRRSRRGRSSWKGRFGRTRCSSVKASHASSSRCAAAILSRLRELAAAAEVPLSRPR